MDAEEFVERLGESVIKDNLVSYRTIFTKTPPDKVTDNYWKEALKLFRSLSVEEQEVLFKIVRQIAVDTTSNILGILDGSSSLGDGFEDFDLTHKTSGKKVNGDLQDIFLRTL